MSAPGSGPVRVALVNDCELVVSGVTRMLAEHPDRVVLVDARTNVPLLSEVDVILCETFGRVTGDGLGLEELTGPDRPKVVVFTWNTEPEAIAASLARGADGHLSNSIASSELVEAIEAVHRGEVVVSPSLECGKEEGDNCDGDWPGRAAGLSPREAEVLSFIAQGLNNQEIASTAHLSINTVKTFIRTAYRKIDVTRRPQAIVWALEHGLAPRGTEAPRLSESTDDQHHQA